MNLILTRTKQAPYGIFGELTDETGAHVCLTLEHSYVVSYGYGTGYGAKIPAPNAWPTPKTNVYTCVRGAHRLHNMTADFETFEITGVPGHSNILFHWGNFGQKDSDGCVLVGQHLIKQADGTEMIDNSRYTFAKFMALQAGVNTFTLTVR